MYGNDPHLIEEMDALSNLSDAIERRAFRGETLRLARRILAEGTENLTSDEQDIWEEKIMPKCVDGISDLFG